MPEIIDLKGHQPPVRAERLEEIHRQAEGGEKTAQDYLHLLRSWLASQEALRQVLAESAQNAERAANVATPQNISEPPSLRALVNVLSAVPRVKDRTATSIALFFLSNPPAWAAFKGAMEAMNNLGWCICGNIPMDAGETVNGRHLCEFCRQTARNAILIVPDITAIFRVEDLLPDRFWYHLVRTDDDRTMADDLQWLVNNIAHKTKVLSAPPRIINGMGNDETSMRCMGVITEILDEDLGLDASKLVVSLPIGIPLDQATNRVDDRTLMAVLSGLGV